ncbi:hypothetical protein EXU85_34065 [Spirosoma sp. KCTC 42546]|nr:hypothetical protein EXU85_34065 [Spirosoma sp. KCTC 42546]
MPLIPTRSAQEITFADFILVHHLPPGMGQGYVHASHPADSCSVAQVLNIARYSNSTILQTDIGQINLSAMDEGDAYKIDMCRHLLSPATTLAIAKRLAKNKTKVSP